MDAFGEATAVVREYGADKFGPFAYYDKHLDCVRVRIKDASICEVRCGPIFDVALDAHTTEIVGFSINGVRHLFEEAGLSGGHVCQIAEMLDGFVKNIGE